MDGYERARAHWKRLNPQTEIELDGALDSFRVLFAYNSGKIENSDIDYHDTREIFENGRILNFTGDPRAVFEQQNQKLCYDFLKGLIARREPLTAALVKEIHAVLTAGTYDERRFMLHGERPGEFKKHDCFSGINEVGCPPDEVEGAVNELLGELLDFPESADALKAAAYLHAVFESIHPFADGNGRVGRAITNYFLMTHGEPPLIVYDEDKKRYYAALEEYDERESLDALYAFFKDETAKTWERACARAPE